MSVAFARHDRDRFRKDLNLLGFAKDHQLFELLSPPKIDLTTFLRLPTVVRQEVAAKHRVASTDTYNRTMSHLALVKEGTSNTTGLTQNEVYTLQMRRSPFGYLVACGIEDLVQRLSLTRITKEEVDFAAALYKMGQVPYFNEKMWRWVVDENEGKLPFKIRGVRDGTIMFPGENLLTIEGPGELIAHFEHIFHRLFYPTLVATRAHALLEIIKDPNRFIEVGKRSAATEELHLIALRALKIGGRLMLTSNDLGVPTFSMKDRGTIGHRYVQRFKTVEESFRFAIENLNAVALLVDLVNSYQGIDLALKLKSEYRHTGKPILVRLDSGNILDQVVYYLRHTNELGFTDPKLDMVVVEGIESLEEIAEIEKTVVKLFGEEALKRVMYGAGGLLVSQNVSRSDASTGLKLSAYEELDGEIIPTMKFSDSPGKGSYPNKPEVVIQNGQRILAQAGEVLPGDVLHLFETLYNNGEVAEESSEIEIIERLTEDFSFVLEARKRGINKLESLRAVPSPMTERLMTDVKKRYGLVPHPVSSFT